MIIKNFATMGGRWGEEMRRDEKRRETKKGHPN